ncbi:MAG: nitrate- and nitrite sensing domain-containing protein [Deltaproteobacteria bacterium]|nr:nitrate- and nitrite sensing domain-containing protein [Deltaproteobacteria bacterium]
MTPRLTLGVKLAGILVPPCLALVLVAGHGLVERWRVLGSMTQVETQVTVSLHANALVHELQRERGATSLFVASRGARFQAEVDAQRRQTDLALEVLRALQLRAAGADWADQVAGALAPLEGLTRLRKRADNLGLAAPEVFDWYTGVIERGLDLMTDMSAVRASSEIHAAQVAAIHLSWAKEMNGRQRAYLSRVFSTGDRGPDVLDGLTRLRTAQEVHTRTFSLHASPEHRRLLADALANAPEVKAAQEMWGIAERRAMSGDYGVDATRWFTAITGRIDRLKTVEDHLLGDLVSTARNLRDDARDGLVAFVVLALSAVLACLALGVTLIRSTTHSLRKMVGAARRIADGDLAVVLEVHSRDEIGALAAAFRGMTANLRSMVGRAQELSAAVDAVVATNATASDRMKRGALEQTHAVHSADRAMANLSRAATSMTRSIEGFSRLLEQNSGAVLSSALAGQGLDESVGQLGVEVAEVARANTANAEDLVGIAQKLARASTESDGAVATLVQIDAATRQIAGHTREAAVLAREMSQHGSRGAASTQATHAGLQTVKNHVVGLVDVIRQTDVQAREIGSVLAVIEEFARRSRLLALNASILAAETGNRGRGFDVVASQMNDLAQKTAQSTLQVTTILTGIASLVSRSVDSAQAAMTCVSNCERQSQETAEALDGMRRRTVTMEEASAQVAHATEDQVKGSNIATNNLDRLSHAIRAISQSVVELSGRTSAVVHAMDRVGELVGRIKGSTSEQAADTRQIATNTGKVMEAIQDINREADVQENESGSISAALRGASLVAESTVRGVCQLDEGLLVLRGHAQALRKEMNRFKLGTDSAPTPTGEGRSHEREQPGLPGRTADCAPGRGAAVG